MPSFICESCQCVDNTALGQYWTRQVGLYPPPYEGKALCSACGSPLFVDGHRTGFGRWHGRFERKHYREWLKECPEATFINGKNFNLNTDEDYVL